MFMDVLLRFLGQALMRLFGWNAMVRFSGRLQNHLELQPLENYVSAESSEDEKGRVLEVWNSMHVAGNWLFRADLARVDALRAKCFPLSDFGREYETAKRERAEAAVAAGKTSFA